MGNYDYYDRRFGVVALICLLLLSANNAPLIAGQDSAEQIFRSRMPHEVQKFAKMLDSNPISVEQNGSGLYKISGGVEYILGGICTFKKNGQLYLYMRKRERPKKATQQEAGPSFYYSMNSQYCFEMLRNKADSAWVVSKVVPITPGFDDSKMNFLMSKGFRRLTDRGLHKLTAVALVVPPLHPNQERISMEKLFELAGFQLGSVVRDDANQNVVRANFSYDAINPKTKKPYRSNCMMEFDLNMHCLPTKLHQTCKNGSTEIVHDWQREWVKTGDDSYSVKEVTDSKEMSNSKLLFSIKSNVEMKINTKALPESDFTLSAFGFPEPPGMEWKKPFPWYLVLAGVGTACLGVFFFLRSRARR